MRCRVHGPVRRSGNWSLEQLPNASSVSTAGVRQWNTGGSAVEAGAAPPPAEMLLYNVALDAGEHIELDTTAPTNAAKVTALQAVVAAYAKTKVGAFLGAFPALPAKGARGGLACLI